jgi:hypothetical protein
MTEDQLRLFPAFRTMPIFDERDPRCHEFAAGAGDGRRIHECTRMDEVERCLANPRLVPLGGVRAGANGRQRVVVYFAGLA